VRLRTRGGHTLACSQFEFWPLKSSSQKTLDADWINVNDNVFAKTHCKENFSSGE